MWTADSLSFYGNVSGIENITRKCPIIIYQTQETAKSEMRYFVRGCAMVPKLGLYGQVNKTETGQKTVSKQIVCLFPFSYQ